MLTHVSKVKIRFSNETNDTIILNIEPYPDRYYIEPGRIVELIPVSVGIDGFIEVSLHREPGGITISFDSLEDCDVFVAGNKMDPKNI
jgi:hypothetical protein